ncbi:phenylacetyl- ligase [Colletotrichum karsti]|uniref:Phenylacetyl- ligase n=1 Tax=Colletotrichum karsti TaxID=1095194 RepID=A0A9P6I3F4_9PEZI|nr:phenylacetyl- ligase [Colletotrichum karsti]KAF9874241.1 phenylacetyl- ligase [Colletotrichum karsti]
MMYTSPYPTPLIPTDVSVSQFILSSNPDDTPPEKPVMGSFRNPKQTLTYSELRFHAARDATFLKSSLGLQEGDLVCILAPNSVSWARLVHSVLWAGGCFCGVNSMATSHELVHYFSLARPKIVAVDEELRLKVEAAISSLDMPWKPSVVILDKGGDSAKSNHPRFPHVNSSNVRPASLFDLSTRDNRKVQAGMCFSSGTSGKPKGVMISHHNLIAYLLTLRATNPFTHNAYMREAFFPSFAHIYGVVSGVLLPAWVGNYVEPMEKFDYLPYLRRCSELKATVLRLVPTAAVRMVKDLDIHNLDLTSVHTIMCSGAALSDATIQGLQRLLGPNTKILNGYGMSETTITLLRDTRSGSKGASVGKPAAGVSVRVVDDDFNDVPEGTEGECLVKAPTVFMGYANNPEETRAAFKDGWLRTGDIVRVDEDGFFWLTGRKKELIKYKGNQIAPAELESVLLSHPSVLDSGVCGIQSDADGEEVPVGFVCLASSIAERDRPRLLKEILRYVDDRVAPYKKLRGGLFFVRELPKNNSGKLLRGELAKLAEDVNEVRAKL